MKPEDIRVGDRLRIREWDDMAAEFGVVYDNIQTLDAEFTDLMREMGLCGAVFTVSSTYDDYSGRTFYRSVEGVENMDENHYADHWYISASMLEPYAGNDDLIDLPEEEFESDLISFMKEGIA